MSSLCVIGAQWGDEGKGKLVDYLTSNADVVARFQGGNNAGHTLVVDGVTTKLHLVPSGILRPGLKCCIGAGVVVNPTVLKQELEGLAKVGVDISPDRFIIDRDAHLILRYHESVDLAREQKKGKDKIGTTGRGIGPAYEDRANRSGVRFAELFHLTSLKEKLLVNLEEKNLYLKHVLGSDEQVNFEEIWRVIEQSAEWFLPYVGNVSQIIDSAIKADMRVVFEGAQGTLLDQVHGTLPFVTSSNTISGAAATGCGVGPKQIQHVLGVAKAYATRVGSGPFPTELHDQTGDFLREKGKEFGTTTGRPRRCGWFDGLAIRRAVRLNGIDSLTITKLDVLSGIEKLKICINYHLNGEKLDDVPSLSSELDAVEPEYIELPGWQDDISNVRKWHHLPAEARFYLSTLSEIAACPISVVSVGPERDSTLFSSGASFVKNFLIKTRID